MPSLPDRPPPMQKSTLLVILGLMLAVLAWQSWMFRYEITARAPGGIVLDRWTGTSYSWRSDQDPTMERVEPPVATP